MNEDELYVEISRSDYYNLKDKSGYYKVFNYNDMVYLKNEKFHRLDGPAIIHELNKICRYYINDKHYTKEEFNQHTDVIQHRIRKFLQKI